MDIQKTKAQIVPIVKKHNIFKAALFGSIVTGNMTDNSDIDLLVDMPKDSSLFDLLRVKIDLEEKLGRRVDLVQYKAIKLRLKDEILSHQESVFI
ncbi:MAG: nucleotidyltransferase domain-containing protein [Patescibacteria group bacterium]